MKIAVMTDSSADISKAEEVELNIHVVRDPISIGSNYFQDEVSISRAELINFMNEGHFAKTSAPIVGEVLTMYETLLKEYDHVLYFPIASDLAGAYNTGLDLARDFEDKVTVINHHAVSYPLYTLLKDVRKLIDAGFSPKQIQNLIESQMCMDAFIIPENMEYLKKGGRVSSTTALVGDFLKIIPILRIKNSVITSEDKTRTYKKAFLRVIQLMMENYPNISDYHVGLVYGDLQPDELQNYINQVIENTPLSIENLEVRPLNAVIMCHTGPKVLGLAVSKKIIA